MKNKGFLYIFVIPVLITLYGFFQLYRMNDGVSPSDYGYDYNEMALRHFLSTIGLISSLLSLFISGAAMALCRYSTTVARKSQNTLVIMFNRCRKVFPFMMLGQIVFCGLSIIFYAFSEIAWIVSAFEMDTGSYKLLTLIGMGVLGVLWILIKSLINIKNCFAMFQPTPSLVIGHNVSEQQAAGLWQWVRELAAKINAVIPDNIVVGMEECFYVTANSVQLVDGEHLTGNTLYFPVTYARFMSEDEIAAVVGHELGHFTGQDTQYSLRFTPLYSGLQNSLEQVAIKAMGNSWIDNIVIYPALYIGNYFLKNLDETVNYWSRIREHAADAVGAKASSEQAFSSALLRICALSDDISQQIHRLYQGKFNDPDLAATVFEALKSRETIDAKAQLENSTTHPLDSHPPTSLRIAALNVQVDDALLIQASRPVSEHDYHNMDKWFADPQGLCQQLTQALKKELGEQGEQIRKELEAVSQIVATEEKLTFRLGKKNVWFMGGFAMVLFIIAAWVTSLIFSGPGAAGSTQVKVAAWTAGFSLFFALASVAMYRKTLQPLFTLSNDSILSVQLNKPVMLVDIEDISMRVIQSNCYLDLIMREDAELPISLLGRFSRSIAVVTKKHKITMIIAGTLLKEGCNEKISFDELYELLAKYLQAAHARRVLIELNS